MPSKDEIYESVIRPLMEQVHDACKAHSIDFVASFQTPSATDSAVHSHSILMVTPAAERSPLLIRMTELVLRGVSPNELVGLISSGEIREPDLPDNVVRMVPPLRVY